MNSFDFLDCGKLSAAVFLLLVSLSAPAIAQTAGIPAISVRYIAQRPILSLQIPVMTALMLTINGSWYDVFHKIIIVLSIL